MIHLWFLDDDMTLEVWRAETPRVLFLPSRAGDPMQAREKDLQNPVAGGIQHT